MAFCRHFPPLGQNDSVTDDVVVAAILLISVALLSFINFFVLCRSLRSMLMVRLIRAEDIPVEDQSLSTYVDVYLLPQNLQSETLQPQDATINVSFRFVLQKRIHCYCVMFSSFKFYDVLYIKCHKAMQCSQCLHDSSDFVD